ncbi:MAG: UDP-N-acetylmuramate--L-alanine ligase, partial [Actinobacteria bacterium]|nr:UDP-N-acetylmuramate--L-alanine ligase [Actinomycetota bacterium]
SGSDLKDSTGLTRLRALGVDVTVGHDPGLVLGVDVVVRSTAVSDTNVEVEAALAAGVPVVRRAAALHAISQLRSTVSIAGTHGKTTTTSMLAICLIQSSLQPSFIVGGDVNDIGSGAVWDDDGELFVVEADESDGTFLEIDTDVAVVTNVERDHLEFHGSFEALIEAFRSFLRSASGKRIVCADDYWSAKLGAEFGAVTYGTASDADYRIVDVGFDMSLSTFSIVGPSAADPDDADPDDAGESQTWGPIVLPVPGLHNVRNATAAFVTAIELGADAQDAVAALGRFGGVARRFEFRGDAGGITFVDDYAHLATEVAAAIDAGRTGGWERVVAVFQPHRFSRTADVWQDFADAFVDADIAVITDIYPAGEKPRPGITGMLIAEAVLDAHPWDRVAYLPSRDQLRTYLADILEPGDLCLTMGAGDLTSLPDELIALQSDRSSQ